MRSRILLLASLATWMSILAAPAQDLPKTTRPLRFPTTNDKEVVFCYAGELYTVAKDGGVAPRLTSGPGYTTFPRFSPDGKRVATTSEDDGIRQVSIMPADAAPPNR